MYIPAVTGEYNPGSCRNSRKSMRLPPRREMRPDSQAMHVEQLHFSNQTGKETRFASLNSRESPRTLSQDENTDVTSGTQNSSVHPKSNLDEANFHCIGSITIPRSTTYRTSGLPPFRKLRRFPETTVSSIEDHQFHYSNLKKVPCNPYHLGMRMISCLQLKRLANFPQTPQEEPSHSNRYVRGTLCFLHQEEWIPRCPDSKERQISQQWLKCRLIFHLSR